MNECSLKFKKRINHIAGQNRLRFAIQISYVIRIVAIGRRQLFTVRIKKKKGYNVCVGAGSVMQYALGLWCKSFRIENPGPEVARSRTEAAGYDRTPVYYGVHRNTWQKIV